jgi:hypothetical protein
MVAPVDIKDRWKVNATADISYTAYPVTAIAGYYSAKRWNADLILNQIFSLPKEFTIDLVSHYTSPELYGIFLTRYYFQQDAGVRKSILRKKN